MQNFDHSPQQQSFSLQPQLPDVSWNEFLGGEEAQRVFAYEGEEGYRNRAITEATRRDQGGASGVDGHSAETIRASSSTGVAGDGHNNIIYLPGARAHSVHNNNGRNEEMSVSTNPANTSRGHEGAMDAQTPPVPESQPDVHVVSDQADQAYDTATDSVTSAKYDLGTRYSKAQKLGETAAHAMFTVQTGLEGGVNGVVAGAKAVGSGAKAGSRFAANTGRAVGHGIKVGAQTGAGAVIMGGALGVEGVRWTYNAGKNVGRVASEYVGDRAKDAWAFIERAHRADKREAFRNLFGKARQVGAAAVSVAKNVQVEVRNNVVEAEAHFFGNIKAGRNATQEQVMQGVTEARRGLIAAGDSARRRAAARREHALRGAAELANRTAEAAVKVAAGTANAARNTVVAAADARHEAGARLHDTHAAVRGGLGRTALNIANGMFNRANAHATAAEAASDRARKARSKKSTGQPHYTQPTLF